MPSLAAEALLEARKFAIGWREYTSKYEVSYELAAYDTNQKLIEHRLYRQRLQGTLVQIHIFHSSLVCDHHSRM